MRSILIFLFIYFPITSFCYSIKTDSVDYPQIGKASPEFTLNNVEYYPKSTVTLSDFRGKWLILDFWTEYCVSCIKSFPKLNAIQDEFKKDIQILMIGTSRGNPQKIRNLYETHRIQKNLNLSIVYENTLSERFGATAYPFIIIVDPEGVVRYITSSFNRDHIVQLLSNGAPTLKRSYTKFEIRKQDSYDKETPLLINKNGGEESNYLFRSVLTEYNELQWFRYNIATYNRMEVLGFGLVELYKYAYGGFFRTFFSTDTVKYGKIWPQLVFETADTLIFKTDLPTKSNFFSYSAHVTDQYFKRFGNVEFNFRQALRNDLVTCFPYSISIEKRMMPCDYLVINDTDLSKLRTQAKEYKFEGVGGKKGGFSAKRMPISQLINIVSSSLEHPENVPLIYNGKNLMIDIVIKSIYYQDRLNELNKMGFSIVRREKEMDVIIVKDR